MPAYHSKIDGAGATRPAAAPFLPLKTKLRGPAPAAPPEGDDIIDETIKYFRPNCLFRNFDVSKSSDRTLVYLTLSMQQFLKECERHSTRQAGEKAVKSLVLKQFPIPGSPGWPLGGLFPPPKDIQEGEAWRLYMKQARDELASRTLDVLPLQGRRREGQVGARSRSARSCARARARVNFARTRARRAPRRRRAGARLPRPFPAASATILGSRDILLVTHRVTALSQRSRGARRFMRCLTAVGSRRDARRRRRSPQIGVFATAISSRIAPLDKS